MDWIHLTHDRDRCRALVNAVMNLRIPYSVGNLLISQETFSFSRRTLLQVISRTGNKNIQLTTN